MLNKLFIILTILAIAAILYYFFSSKAFKKTYFSPILFYQLFLILLAITTAFAVLYYILSLEGPILMVGTPDGTPIEGDFLTYLYFSGVTILTVGFGDLVPVGTARLFALIEAGIGILMPTAYFIKAVHSSKGKDDE